VTHDAVRAALRELARELAPLLPERARAIAVAFERARANPDDREARGTLRLLVHRMRGTAGSHGFLDLSREAGCIEDGIMAEDAEAASDWASWAERVEKIRAGAERAARDAASEGP
jgi:hypothetical protein